MSLSTEFTNSELVWHVLRKALPKNEVDFENLKKFQILMIALKPVFPKVLSSVDDKALRVLDLNRDMCLKRCLDLFKQI